jgi:UDP-2,4-diacetamido-2,4,6-trideoxy-beta-L-altropyranose hydrolase
MSNSCSRRRIFFRADGSSEIGFGHMSRTLSLASMLKDEFYCTFVSCSTAFKKEAEEFCENRILLNSDDHFNEFLTILSIDDIVVLDNYFFESEYQKKIKNIGCKLVCIDDIHATHFYADIVINHANGVCKNNYSVEDYTTLLLGYDYAMLRPEFLDIAKSEELKHTNKEFDLTMCIGGADPSNITQQIITSLDQASFKGSIAVVSTKKLNLHENNLNIKQLQNLSAKEMANLFSDTKLGFLPASTVAIEAIACRMAFACCYFVDNQINIYKSLASSGACIPIGSLNNIDLITTINSIKDVISNQATLHTIINREKLLLDGNVKNRFLEVFKEL